MNGFLRWIGALICRIGSRAAAVSPANPRNLEWELILCAALRDNILVALRYRDTSGRELGFQYFGLPVFGLFYGLDWVATVPPTAVYWISGA